MDQLDAVVLTGGKGTRLAGVVPGLPKTLAPVGGRPFLDYVLRYLAESGVVRRAVLATGHLGELVEEHYAEHGSPIPIVVSRETEPLGTAGALSHALPFVDGDRFVAVNGDTLTNCDLEALVEGHLRTEALVSIALVRVPDASRFGTVEADGPWVRSFREKAGRRSPGLINAGVYVVERSVLADRVGRLSMETDVLPLLAEQRRLAAVAGGTMFVDMGVPESYEEACRIGADLLKWRSAP